FALLAGDNNGGFFNPQLALTGFTGSAPEAVAAGRFIIGDNNLELAILSKDDDTVSIYPGDGAGHFSQLFATRAGNQPTGRSVADVSRPGGGGPDGIPDLLVGNAFGDLLILAGNGDGTFSQYRRVDQNVSLAVAQTPEQDQNTFFFGNQGSDQLGYLP